MKAGEKQLIVHKGRTNRVSFSLGYDVSGETFASQIRVEANQTSPLIATWNVAFLTDGTDGELVLTMDNLVSGAIVQAKGYMDVKRVSGGEPLAVHDDVLEVLFKETVTV